MQKCCIKDVYKSSTFISEVFKISCSHSSYLLAYHMNLKDISKYVIKNSFYCVLVRKFKYNC